MTIKRDEITYYRLKDVKQDEIHKLR